MTDASVYLPAKRKRGRPRKDTNLSILRAPQSPTPTRKPQETNKNNTTHGMVGTMIYGVIEGLFDAGYLVSVRIGNNALPFRGVIFEQKKFIPITPANDIAPQANLYQRQEVQFPVYDNQTMGPVLPSTPPHLYNHSAFMVQKGSMNNMANTGDMISESNRLVGKANGQVHGKAVESGLGTSMSSHDKLSGSNIELHLNFAEDAPQSAFQIQQNEMICGETDRSERVELQEIPSAAQSHHEAQVMKTQLPQQTEMYYHEELRSPHHNFHQGLSVGNQSHRDSHSTFIDGISESPNLKLDLAPTVHEEKPLQSESQACEETNYFVLNEMKSPNIGYHQALVAGNPLLLPPEIVGEHMEFNNETRQGDQPGLVRNVERPRNAAGVGEPENNVVEAGSLSAPYKLELATPQSDLTTRPGKHTSSSPTGCISDLDFVLGHETEARSHQCDLYDTKHR